MALAATLLSSPAVGCTLPGNATALADEAGAAMNAERDRRGRAPLARDARLDRAAQDHACWMSETGKFSHKGARGSSMASRIEASGFPIRLAAENIALGQASASAVVADWMASSGHRENILLGGADAYGIGLAMLGGQPVWVMVFAGS